MPCQSPPQDCRPKAVQAVIYDPRVEADFAVELGTEDETLDFPWEAPNGPRYYDLKHRPELLLNIEEARRIPELREFLAAVNSVGSVVESAKCDAWASMEIHPHEEIFGASCKFGSYVDLLFAAEPLRFSFPDHERLAREITALLRRAPEMPAAAEFLIRRCYFPRPDAMQEGFYFTFYLFGYGDDEYEPQSRLHWAIALKLVENALRQLSAARPLTPRVE